MRHRRRGGRPRKQLTTWPGLRRAPTSIEAIGQSWLSELHTLEYAPTTIEVSRWAFDSFHTWLTENQIKELGQINAACLAAFQAHLRGKVTARGTPLSQATRRSQVSAIRRFLRWMFEQGHLQTNLAARFILPKRPARALPSLLSHQELRRIFAYPRTLDPLGLRNRSILELLYATGIRRTELVQLNLEHVDLPSATLWIRQGKGGKDRVLPLARYTTCWLEAYLRRTRPRLLVNMDEQAFFITGYGSRFNPNYLGNWVRKVLNECGIQKRGACHLFRHSCATHMLENGADLRAIQQLLGHARLDTTQIYTNVSITHLRSVYAHTHPSARQRRGSR